MNEIIKIRVGKRVWTVRSASKPVEYFDVVDSVTRYLDLLVKLMRLQSDKTEIKVEVMP